MNFKDKKYWVGFSKALAIVILVYLFLLSITLIGDTFKLMGEGFAQKIMRGVSNPFVGLFTGMLCTAIVQSSSMTTSLVVSMVAGNVLTIKLAIPLIMGGNIGTTITNVIVSLGHIGKKDEFERAFAVATMHDFFNILSVIIVFPFQYYFNILGVAAGYVATAFENIGGLKIINPISKILTPVSQLIIGLFSRYPWINILVALIILFFALTYLVKVVKSLVLAKVELFFDQYIFKNATRGFLLGMFLTAIVQSSSITTSLAIPLAAAGVLSQRKVFPYTVGANIGTTITAFLAAIATNSVGAITIAFAHTLFNVIGACIFLPLQKIPIKLSRLLASLTRKNRLYAIGYVILLFFIIPLIIIFITR
ncbi:MAG TPA: Na/Pi symporter [Candidatus Marinimicrobia bacterium]|nr:Na/Pi symporter [Candidatus Neomarinimicrobiota bacterium]HRU92384.1 Na/Pi symporter [Candidatus Neomarinimicrobiota bacterium]